MIAKLYERVDRCRVKPLDLGGDTAPDRRDLLIGERNGGIPQRRVSSAAIQGRIIPAPPMRDRIVRTKVMNGSDR
jgi:hypothetical protein